MHAHRHTRSDAVDLWEMALPCSPPAAKSPVDPWERKESLISLLLSSATKLTHTHTHRARVCHATLLADGHDLAGGGGGSEEAQELLLQPCYHKLSHRGVRWHRHHCFLVYSCVSSYMCVK